MWLIKKSHAKTAKKKEKNPLRTWRSLRDIKSLAKAQKRKEKNEEVC